MRPVYLITLLFFTINSSLAQDTTAQILDQRSIEVSGLDTEVIESFRSDGDFDYYDKPQSTSFKKWIDLQLSKFIAYLLGDRATVEAISSLLRIFWYAIIAICVLVTGFVIYLLVKNRKKRLFERGDKLMDHELKTENIHEINFDKSIDKAISKNNYRKAVRLIYLYALKLLSDKEMISYHVSKTNHDYIDEISAELIRENFSKLGYFFNYLWYGHFEIDESMFESVELHFQT